MSALRKVIVAVAIVSMVGASTSAIAASSVRGSAPVATAAGSWSTLSVMTGSTATTAAVAARDDDDRAGGFWNPPLLPLAVILATIAAAIYILLKKDSGRLGFNTPISPN